MKGKKADLLTEILQVKNFEGTKIRTLNLPAWLFFITVTPSLETLASFGFHGSAPTLGDLASTLEDLAASAIATISATSHKTRSRTSRK